MPWTCALAVDGAFSVDIQAPGWYFMSLSGPPRVQIGVRQLAVPGRAGRARAGAAAAHGGTGAGIARTELFPFQYAQQELESETMFVLRSPALYTPLSSCELTLRLWWHGFPGSGVPERAPPIYTFRCLATKRLRLSAIGAPCVCTHVEHFEYMNYLSFRLLVLWGYSEGADSGSGQGAPGAQGGPPGGVSEDRGSPGPLPAPSSPPGADGPGASPGPLFPQRSDSLGSERPMLPPEPLSARPQPARLRRSAARRIFLRYSHHEARLASHPAQPSRPARPAPQKGAKPPASRPGPYEAWEALLRTRREDNEEYRRRYRQRAAKITEAYFTRVLSGSPYAHAFEAGGEATPGADGRPAARRPGDTEPLLPRRRDTPHSFDLFLQGLAANRGLRTYLLSLGMGSQIGGSLVAPVEQEGYLASKNLARSFFRQMAQRASLEAQDLASKLARMQETELGRGLRPGISLASAKRALTFRLFWQELTASGEEQEEQRYNTYSYIDTLVKLRAGARSVEEVREYGQPMFLVCAEREGRGAKAGKPLPGGRGPAGSRAAGAAPGPAGGADGSGSGGASGIGGEIVSDDSGGSESSSTERPGDAPEVVQEQNIGGVALAGSPTAGSLRPEGERQVCSAPDPGAPAAPPENAPAPQPQYQEMTPADVYIFFHGYKGTKSDLRYLRDRLIEVDHCHSFLEAARRAGDVRREGPDPEAGTPRPLLPLFPDDGLARKAHYVLLKSYERSTTESVLVQAKLAVREILDALASAGLAFLDEEGGIRRVSQRLRRINFIAHSQGCIVAEAVLLHRSFAPLLPFLCKFVGVQGPNFGMYTRRKIVRLGFGFLMLRKREMSLRELGLRRFSVGDWEERYATKFAPVAEEFGIRLGDKGCLLGALARASKLGQFKEACLFGSYNDGYVHPSSSLALQTFRGDAETVSALRAKYDGVLMLRKSLVAYDERELRAKFKVFDRMTKRAGHIKPLIDYWAVRGIVGLI